VQPVNSVAPASSVSAAGPAAAAGKHKQDKTPEQITEAFSKGGLLVRTAQTNNAHYELRDNHISVDQGRDNNDVRLRKWSMAHSELKPNFFQMGPEHPREAAFLALPDKVGNHVVGVHEKDNFSGSIRPDMKNMPYEQSKAQMDQVLNTLKTNQRTNPKQQLDNSEIQTVGMPSDSIAGMLFNPAKPKFGQSASETTWEGGGKARFENMLQKAGPDFHGRSFPVFRYQDTGSGTRLEHFDTIRVPGQAADAAEAA
jgi:hypothetical protein